MRFIKDPWGFLSRKSPFPISFLIHLILLLILTYINWYIPAQRKDEENLSASILLNGQKEGKMKFQGKDGLDSFKTKDIMVYPLPEIDYRPVLPDIKYYPEPKLKEDLNLVGVEAINSKWLIPSSGRQPLHTGEEKLTGSFTRHIQILREGGLDIVFVFDSTSSMAQFLRQVKFKIANMVATFKKLVPTARIGLVTYRDAGDDFITSVHKLTHSTKSLEDFLQKIDPVGGGDWEEAVDEALRVAIDELNWKENSKKIILLIGDAPPHKKDIEKTDKLIEKFRKKMGGVVASLDTSYQSFKPMEGDTTAENDSKKVLEEFKHFAEIGGGESARLTEEEKVIRQMVVLVFGTKWESCLDEFLKNL